MTDSSSEISFDKQIKTNEHVRHVTIRQIIGAERKHDSAPWTIERAEISAVMIVANILDCTQNKDGILDFHLDDGTGRIKCSMNQKSTAELSFNHFAYVRVVGTISQPRSREVKYFNATGLAEVTDPHEIFYHCMQAIHNSLLIKILIGQTKYEDNHRNIEESNQGSPPTGNDVNHIHQENVLPSYEKTERSDPEILKQEIDDDPRRTLSAARGHDELEFHHGDPWSTVSRRRTLSSDTMGSFHTAYSQRSASPELQGQEMAPEAAADFPPHVEQRARKRDPYQNLSSLQRDIILSISHTLERMDMDAQRDGVHINIIVDGLRKKYGNHLNERQVGDAIEELHEEAYIFTTIDDRHYNIVD